MIFTPIKLDKMRNIVLGFKAMQEFKNITGKSLTKLDFEDEIASIISSKCSAFILKWLYNNS